MTAHNEINYCGKIPTVLTKTAQSHVKSDFVSDSKVFSHLTNPDHIAAAYTSMLTQETGGWSPGSNSPMINQY